MGRLDELEKITNAATPGPWSQREGGAIYIDGNHETIAVCDFEFRNDAAFIAAARTAMPILLEIARAAKAYMAPREDSSHEEYERLHERLEVALGKLEAGG